MLRLIRITVPILGIKGCLYRAALGINKGDIGIVARERSEFTQCRKAVVVEAGLDDRDVLVFLPPVKPGALSELVSLEEEVSCRDINAAHRIDVTRVHVVKPKPVFAEELKVLPRIELWLKLSSDKFTGQRMRTRVEDVKALV